MTHASKKCDRKGTLVHIHYMFIACNTTTHKHVMRASKRSGRMKAVSPGLPCSWYMYVENNGQCFHIAVHCGVLRSPRKAVWRWFVGPGEIHWPTLNTCKWGALSREKDELLEGGWKLMPSWGHPCLRRPFDSCLWLLSIFLHHLVIPGILTKGWMCCRLWASQVSHTFSLLLLLCFSPPPWGTEEESLCCRQLGLPRTLLSPQESLWVSCIPPVDSLPPRCFLISSLWSLSSAMSFPKAEYGYKGETTL